MTQAGWLAQKRLSSGVRLNQIEATVLISCQIHELIRKGQDPRLSVLGLMLGGYSIADLQKEGREMLGQRLVMVLKLLHF